MGEHTRGGPVFSKSCIPRRACGTIVPLNECESMSLVELVPVAQSFHLANARAYGFSVPAPTAKSRGSEENSGVLLCNAENLT